MLQMYNFLLFDFDIHILRARAKTPDLQWLQEKTPDLRFDQTEIMAFKVFQNFKSNFDLIIFIET